jgi:hypothetical protein
MKKIVIIVLLLLLNMPGAVFASEGPTVAVTAPDIRNFPYNITSLDLHAADGSFINGLTSDGISILEDAKTVPIVDLQEKRIGLQVTVAINAAPTFANRNTLGISRFQYLVEYLNLWAEQQREITIDDLSLVTNSGLHQIHLKDVTSWQTAFLSYDPVLKDAVPSPDLLGQAVDIALGYNSDSFIGKAILYITPLPETELGPVLKDVVDRANQAKTKIFVWMITSKAQFTDPRAEELRQLAIQTGGQFTAFSGTEELPSISELIEPLRSIYQITYKSSLTQSGQHNLVGQVRLTDQTITSLPVLFNINVQPPNPIFVNLPSQIIRSTTVTNKNQMDFLAPIEQLVEILVEYPDGYKRELSSSSLLVDGQVAAVSSQPAFDRFTWNLSSLKTNGRHTLQVQVTDELGLTNRSVEVPVEIVIILPAINRWADFFNGGGIYILLGLIFAAGVLSAVLFLHWRNRSQTKDIHPPSGSRKDPVSQPVKIRQDKAKKDQRLTKPQPFPRYKSVSLIQVTRDTESTPGYDIPIGERKFTIGSDRQIADVVINAEGVAPRHAMVWTDHNGSYYVANAVPGVTTLVNDKPIPEEGVTLNQGDLIIIGTVTYRFQEYPIHNLR